MQTPVFLFAVYRDRDLLASLAKHRATYIVASLVIAAVYAGVIFGCGCMEARLWSHDDATAASIARCATMGRIAVVAFLALGCASVLGVMKKPAEPA